MKIPDWMRYIYIWHFKGFDISGAKVASNGWLWIPNIKNNDVPLVEALKKERIIV